MQLPVIRSAAHFPPPGTPDALALATKPAREQVARLPVNLQAHSAAQPPGSADLSLDSCLRRPRASSFHRFPAVPAAAELARPPKVWGSSRSLATAPHRERGSARQAAWPSPEPQPNRDAQPNIPDRNTARK